MFVFEHMGFGIKFKLTIGKMLIVMQYYFQC